MMDGEHIVPSSGNFSTLSAHCPNVTKSSLTEVQRPNTFLRYEKASAHGTQHVHRNTIPSAKPMHKNVAISSTSNFKGSSQLQCCDEYDNMSAGTATNTRVHAAATRGIRIKWSRYDSLFKMLPSVLQSHPSSAQAYRDTSQLTDMEQIECIIANCDIVIKDDVFVPSAEDMEGINQVLSYFHQTIKSSTPRDEWNSDDHCIPSNRQLSFLCNFGASSAWAAFEYRNCSEKDFSMEEEFFAAYEDKYNHVHASDNIIRQFLGSACSIEATDLNTFNTSNNSNSKKGRRPLARRFCSKCLHLVSFIVLNYYQFQFIKNYFGKYKCKFSNSLNIVNNKLSYSKHAYDVPLSYYNSSLKSSLSDSNKTSQNQYHPSERHTNYSQQHKTFIVSNPPPPNYNKKTCNSNIWHVENLGGMDWQVDLSKAQMPEFYNIISGNDDFVGLACCSFLDAHRNCTLATNALKSNLRDLVLKDRTTRKRMVDVPYKLQAIQSRYAAKVKWDRLTESLVAGLCDKSNSMHISKSLIHDKAYSATITTQSKQFSVQDNKRSCTSNVAGASQIQLRPHSKVENNGFNHQSTKKNIVESKDGVPANGEESFAVYCSVCSNDTSPQFAMIVTCCRCEMSVHNTCYSIEKSSDELDLTEWLCRRCEYEKRLLGSQWLTNFTPGSITCCICGTFGGALKRTITNDWVHILCAVWSYAECENYEQLEPWNINSDKNRSQQTQCNLCGRFSGYALQCNVLGCASFFHPMCAWLHGLYVNVYYKAFSYMIWNGKPDCCFKEICVDIFCSKHTPSNAQTQDRQIEMELRMRRYINRDNNPDIFLKSEKRDKRFNRVAVGIRYREPNLSTRLFGIQDDSIPNLLDICNANECAICFSSNALTDNGSFIHCQKCDISVHQLCYKTIYNSKVDDTLWTNEHFVCDACKWAHSSNSVVCRLCPKKGGAMKLCNSLEGVEKNSLYSEFNPFSNGTQLIFAHLPCLIWSSFFNSVAIKPKRPLKSTNNETIDANLCEICNICNEHCIQCSHKGCNHYMHPLCAKCKGYFWDLEVDATLNLKLIFFCEQHSRLRQKFSSSVNLFLKFRSFFEFSLRMVNQMINKEKIERSWIRKRKQYFDVSFPVCRHESKRVKTFYPLSTLKQTNSSMKEQALCNGSGKVKPRPTGYQELESEHGFNSGLAWHSIPSYSSLPCWNYNSFANGLMFLPQSSARCDSLHDNNSISNIQSQHQNIKLNKKKFSYTPKAASSESLAYSNTSTSNHLISVPSSEELKTYTPKKSSKDWRGGSALRDWEKSREECGHDLMLPHDNSRTTEPRSVDCSRVSKVKDLAIMEKDYRDSGQYINQVAQGGFMTFLDYRRNSHVGLGCSPASSEINNVNYLQLGSSLNPIPDSVNTSLLPKTLQSTGSSTGLSQTVRHHSNHNSLDQLQRKVCIDNTSDFQRYYTASSMDAQNSIQPDSGNMTKNFHICDSRHSALSDVTINRGNVDFLIDARGYNHHGSSLSGNSIPNSTFFLPEHMASLPCDLQLSVTSGRSPTSCAVWCGDYSACPPYPGPLRNGMNSVKSICTQPTRRIQSLQSLPYDSNHEIALNSKMCLSQGSHEHLLSPATNATTVKTIPNSKTNPEWLQETTQSHSKSFPGGCLSEYPNL